MIKQLLILSLIICLTQALNGQDIVQCANQNCTYEKQLCLADYPCTQAWMCYEKCPINDVSCHEYCRSLVIENQNYWAVGICTGMCIEVLELKEHDPIIECVLKNCTNTIIACEQNDDCLSTYMCMENCATRDYSCTADCVVDTITNQGNPLIEVINCKEDCLYRFIQPTTEPNEAFFFGMLF